ncbi:MAG TPA: hypothetical protein K8V54_08835 [Corynebacterium kroppenstedtii]|nr:hypothetical protein [Corynebacterium kroppenstedtii]
MAIHFSFPAKRVEFLADAISREARGDAVAEDAADSAATDAEAGDPSEPDGEAVLAPVKA